MPIPVVAARMFVTKLTGGSTSPTAFSKRRPSSASAHSGPQSWQIRKWDSKRSDSGPLKIASRASLRRASNSAHCIPFLLSPGITSPAYRYVAAGAQVPHARG